MKKRILEWKEKSSQCLWMKAIFSPDAAHRLGFAEKT